MFPNTCWKTRSHGQLRPDPLRRTASSILLRSYQSSSLLKVHTPTSLKHDSSLSVQRPQKSTWGVYKGGSKDNVWKLLYDKIAGDSKCKSKNLMCAKCTYFQRCVVTFLSAGIGATPLEKQADLNWGPNGQHT